MKKRISVVGCTKTIVLLIVLSISSVKTNAKQPISDINDVSFDLVQDTYTHESETDLSIDQLQMRSELINQVEELNQIEDTLSWFKKYKELKEEFSQVLEEESEHNQITDEYSTDEIRYIERMVQTETNGCSFEAHVNVANVVFNRIDHDKFPDNPIGVVTSPSQFCYGRTKITESVKLAVEYAYMFPDTTQGALFFKSGKKTKTFCGRSLIFEDDAGHYFY